MNKDKIKEIRRGNLEKWFNSHSIPEREKSYISQLKKGTVSFGEKAARRLELDYKMPRFYLDTEESNNVDSIKNNETFTIEVLDITASAGTGYLNSDVLEVIKLIEYDKEQARLLFNGLMSDDLKVISIKGDSMQGTFESGDSLYINISINSFESDGIYVFTFGKGLFIKRLQLIKDKLIVISDNKSYREWEITESELDQLYIHGKVMLSQSMFLRKHG